MAQSNLQPATQFDVHCSKFDVEFTVHGSRFTVPFSTSIQPHATSNIVFNQQTSDQFWGS